MANSRLQEMLAMLQAMRSQQGGGGYSRESEEEEWAKKLGLLGLSMPDERDMYAGGENSPLGAAGTFKDSSGVVHGIGRRRPSAMTEQSLKMKAQQQIADTAAKNDLYKLQQAEDQLQGTDWASMVGGKMEDVKINLERDRVKKEEQDKAYSTYLQEKIKSGRDLTPQEEIDKGNLGLSYMEPLPEDLNTLTTSVIGAVDDMGGINKDNAAQVVSLILENVGKVNQPNAKKILLAKYGKFIPGMAGMLGMAPAVTGNGGDDKNQGGNSNVNWTEKLETAGSAYKDIRNLPQAYQAGSGLIDDALQGAEDLPTSLIPKPEERNLLSPEWGTKTLGRGILGMPGRLAQMATAGIDTMSGKSVVDMALNPQKAWKQAQDMSALAGEIVNKVKQGQFAELGADAVEYILGHPEDIAFALMGKAGFSSKAGAIASKMKGFDPIGQGIKGGFSTGAKYVGPELGATKFTPSPTLDIMGTRTPGMGKMTGSYTEPIPSMPKSNPEWYKNVPAEPVPIAGENPAFLEWLQDIYIKNGGKPGGFPAWMYELSGG